MEFEKQVKKFDENRSMINELNCENGRIEQGLLDECIRTGDTQFLQLNWAVLRRSVYGYRRGKE